MKMPAVHWSACTAGGTEVRDEQRIRPPRVDPAETDLRFPDRCRRRRRREDHPGRCSFDSGRVADKGEAGLVVEVADVMGGAWRVGDIESPPPASIRSPPASDVSALAGTGATSPQSVSI